MRFAAILDVAAFVWDEQKFKQDQTEFHHVIETMPKILALLIKERIPVVFRTELLDEVRGSFPYKLIPNQYREFKTTTIKQLTKLNLIDYNAPAPCGVSAAPPLSRHYFSASINSEINNLLCYIYLDNNSTQHFLTFSAFWSTVGEITIKNGKSKIIETKLCDDCNDHDSIVKSLKKIFEHNPKHKRVKTYLDGKPVAPLRCYNEMVKDTTAAQKILDEAVFVDGFYYGYDDQHSTYVRFMLTEKNFFHGFEEQLSADLIAKIEKAKAHV